MTWSALATRLATAAAVMIVVALLTFLLVDLAPGSYVDDLAVNPQISAETLARVRAQYGLDRPFYVKFVRWGLGVVSGDLGYSFVYQRPIAQLVGERIWNTVLLNLVALAAAWMAGVALGVCGAAARESPADRAIGVVTTLLLATPGVVLAVVLLAIAARFALPIGGLSSSASESMTAGARALDRLRHLFLPATAVALAWLPAIARQTRRAIVTALRAPHMLAAEAKGVPPSRLLLVHALREALGPLTSLFGLSLSALLSASMVVEVVMAWPGIGQLMYDAVFKRDLFLVVDLVQLSALLLLIGNVAGDLALRRLDPRTVA